jgi:hypothetical protein
MSQTHIVDYDGIVKLQKSGKLLDYQEVKSSRSVSSKYYSATAKDFSQVQTYKPLYFTIGFKEHYSIVYIIKKFVSYFIEENEDNLEVVKDYDLKTDKINLYFYLEEIPVYVIDKSFLVETINKFRENDTFLCIDNPLLIDQVTVCFKSKDFEKLIKKIDNFYYYNSSSLNKYEIEYIVSLRDLLPANTIKYLDENIAMTLGLQSYNIISAEGVYETYSPRELVNVMLKTKGYYYEVDDETRENIKRVAQKENPIFKYDKEIEFPLVESILRERGMTGSLDRETITNEIQIKDGHVTCPTFKEFNNALSKIKFENHHVYHTLDFDDACAFRVKLTAHKKRSVMIPSSSLSSLEEKNSYFVYYKSDYLVEKVTGEEMKSFKLTIMNVYGLDKKGDQSMNELFTIKTIDGEEVKDDSSILGYFSDHHTLGLYD